jgi:hypothetical protein
MIASSRRLTKVRALQVASTALMCSIETTGTGSSGTVGGLSFANGEYSISSSLAIQRNHCCRPRYRLFAVAGLCSCSRRLMKARRWVAVMPAGPVTGRVESSRAAVSSGSGGGDVRNSMS